MHAKTLWFLNTVKTKHLKVVLVNFLLILKH